MVRYLCLRAVQVLCWFTERLSVPHNEIVVNCCDFTLQLKLFFSDHPLLLIEGSAESMRAFDPTFMQQ